MNLTAQLKLEPTADQAFALRRTLVASNAACDYISGVAWELKTFRQFDLHRLCYREVRKRFDLSAQAAVRCISKVADAYRLDRKAKRSFRPMVWWHTTSASWPTIRWLPRFLYAPSMGA